MADTTYVKNPHPEWENFLNFHEASVFLEKTLQMPEERLAVRDMQLVRDICFEFKKRTPYQNMLCMSRKPADRRVSTVEEVREEGLAGRGGTCYEVRND